MSYIAIGRFWRNGYSPFALIPAVPEPKLGFQEAVIRGDAPLMPKVVGR
jgi:hypothetical protein